MIMINMNCPSCGVHGRVPKTLGNVRLLCKKCQEPFHMNSEGIAIAGEPPPPPESERPVHDAAADDPGLIVDLWLAKIGKVLRLIVKVAGAAAAVVVLSFLYSNFKPNSLLGRGNEVSDAILKDDIRKFNTFAYGETGIDLFEWYGFMRSKLDELRLRVPRKEMGYLTKIKQQNTSEKTAELILRLGSNQVLTRRQITSDEELTGQALKYMDVKVYWKADAFGRWWIDGATTLRGPNKSRGTSEAPRYSEPAQSSESPKSSEAPKSSKVHKSNEGPGLSKAPKIR
jgi:hypothetical protein